jgi:hypothetical protein
MSFAIVAAVAAPIVVGGVTALVQNQKANKAEEDAQTAQGVIDEIERNRAPVYDASGKIRDMKGEIDEMKSLVTNPYANLGVATEAAEIQMEQTDIALANTMDVIAATGAGAGGATALAQAALQSKRGVAADIQRQEAQNQKLRAQGDQQVNQQLLSLEQQKLSLEGQAISAEERAAAGEDARVQMQLDRAYGEKDFYTSRELSMRDAATDSLMGGFSAGASVFGGAVGAGLIGSGGGATSSTPSYGNYFGNYSAPYMANPNPVQTYSITNSTGPAPQVPLAGTTDIPSYSNPGATSALDITGGQTAVDFSDRRLKHDYKIIGKSKSGLNIYEFSYIHKPGRYTGVMSDEISKEAVVVNKDGYDMVDYSKIDVDFKKL